MDLTPLAQGNSESWYSTEEELDMAVNEFYVLNYWKDPLENAEMWTDNFTYRNVHRTTILYGTLDGSSSGDNWVVPRLWERNYRMIARANTLLEKINNNVTSIAENKIQRYKAEAYFARACKYAELLFFYGDVPYHDQYITISDAFQMSRTPKDEIKPLVYADFDNAIDNLPVSYGTSSVHFTKGAACAMKARFALWMGDWGIAAEAAKQCMDLNEYELHEDFSELFLANTKNNTKEKIFAIPRSIASSVILEGWFVNNERTRNAGGYGSACPSWDLFAAFLCTDGLPIDESPLFDPQNPFENRDPRCEKTIVKFGTTHLGFEYDTHPDKLQVMNYTAGKLQTNQDNRSNNQYASYNGLNWKKGIDEAWTVAGGVECDYVVIRYADVLLMYAEAKIELNEIDDTVLKAINMVRARGFGAKVTETNKYPAVTNTGQEQLRQTVRLERRVELAKEGLRYMDLVRWRLAEKALNKKNYGVIYPATASSKAIWFWPSTPQIDENGLADFSGMEATGLIAVLSERIWVNRQYLWPVPTIDMEICPNLTQNDGY
jgi:hypothetical protein